MNISFNSNTSNPFNTTVRRQKFGVGSLIFLLFFGAVFTIAGIFAIKSSKIDPSWQTVSGQVASSNSNIGSSTAGSGNSTTYTPVVSYTVAGQTYRVTSSTGSSTYPPIGSSKQVAYNPQQPAQAKVIESTGGKALLYLFPAIGILSILFAPILYIKSLRRNQTITKLTQSGQKVQGVLVDIQTTNGNNNANSYKIVVAAANQTGGVQNYVSDSLAGIGGLAMADFRNSPIPIDVYIDPANPANYYVDVSEIPNLTPDRILQLIRNATAPVGQSIAPQAAAPTYGVAQSQPAQPYGQQPPFSGQPTAVPAQPYPTQPQPTPPQLPPSPPSYS